MGVCASVGSRWRNRGRQGLLLSLVVALVSTAAPAHGLTSLSAGFEARSLAGWSSVSNATIGTAFAHDGAYGVRVVTRPDQGGFLAWRGPRVSQGLRYARVSAWVRIPSFGAGQNVSVMTLHNANGVNHFNLWREGSTGRFRYDLFRRNNAYSTMRVRTDRWYFIEALVDFGGRAGTTYRARVRINGVRQPPITSTGQTGTTVRNAWFGAVVFGASNTRYYDSLALRVSSTPLRFTR